MGSPRTRDAARHLMRHLRALTVAVGIGVVATGAASAQAPEARDPLTYVSGPARIKLGLEAGTQYVFEQNAFWNLADTFAPTTNYKSDRSWQEGYVKPSIRADYKFTSAFELYGGLSGIGAYTWGKDVFDVGDTGRFLIEEAFGGLRWRDQPAGMTFEFSGGAQNYRIGTGMLIATGGGNGFERGAVIFGPRKAWEMTAIARLSSGPFLLDGFYLDANELKSNDTNTRLAGARAEWQIGPDQIAGIAAAKVIESSAPYVQAPPGGSGLVTILPDGRDGLAFVHGYAKFNPVGAALPGFWVGGEGAYQWNDRYDLRAWAGRLEVGRTFAHIPWSPTLSYAYSTFSGDDPATTRLERFDPLFYDGAHGTWSTGANASLTFINTNVAAHRLSLVLMPTQQDIVTMRYWRAAANELNSPLQFGQGTRLSVANGVPTLASGVPRAALSDDFLLEYTRVVSQNLFVTTGVAVSLPGAGLDAVTNGAADTWVGGYANVVVTY